MARYKHAARLWESRRELPRAHDHLESVARVSSGPGLTSPSLTQPLSIQPFILVCDAFQIKLKTTVCTPEALQHEYYYSEITLKKSYIMEIFKCTKAERIV